MNFRHIRAWSYLDNDGVHEFSMQRYEKWCYGIACELLNVWCGESGIRDPAPHRYAKYEIFQGPTHWPCYAQATTVFPVLLRLYIDNQSQ